MTSNQTRNVVWLLGGPASGKGTLSSYLARQFPNFIHHVYPGLLLRKASVDRQNPDAELISTTLAAGKLVPVGITLSLLEKEFVRPSGLFLVDGFPREAGQADLFIKKFGAPKLAMSIDTTPEVMRARMNARIAEPLPGATSEPGPPRSDDNKEIFERRLQSHFKQHTILVRMLHDRGIKHVSIRGEPNVDREGALAALIAEGLLPDDGRPRRPC